MSLIDRIKGMFNRVFKKQKELPVTEEPEKKDDVFDTVFEVDGYDFDPKVIEDDSGKTQTIGELIDELDVKARGDRKNPVTTNYNPKEDNEKPKTKLKTTITESEIDIGLDNLTSVKISDNSLNAYDEEGQKFASKRVDVKTENGNYFRTSDITLGHNRNGFMLEDGEYASHDEIMKALEKALQPEHHLNQVVRVKSKVTGKYIDVDSLKKTISGIIRGNSQFEISDTTHEEDYSSADVKLRNDRDEFIKKGLLILDSGNLTLPNGEFVSKKDIETALGMYLFETKTFTLEQDDSLKDDITGKHVARDKDGNPIVVEADPNYKAKHGPKEDELKDDIHYDVIDEELEAELAEDLPDKIDRPKGARNYTKAGYFPEQPESMDRPDDRMKYTKAGYVPERPEPMDRPEDRIKYTKAGYIPKHDSGRKEEPRKKYEAKHVKKTGKKWKVWPLVLAGVATISLGYGINHVPRDPKDNYVAKYKLVQLYDAERPETEDEVIRRINQSFEIGKTIPVPDGVVVHASSDYTQDGANKSQGVIGKKSLQLNGRAKVDYISLINQDGRIVQVTYDAEKDGNVEEAIERATQEKGFDRNSGRVMLHLSGVNIYGKEVKAGWADQQDLIQEQDKVPRQIQYYEEGPEITGTREHFNGSMVVDAPDGAHIVGNIPSRDLEDESQVAGKQYVDVNGNKIEIKEFKVENHPEEVPDGIELEWDFDNVANKKAIAGLFVTLGVVGFAYENQKKILKETEDKTNRHDEEPSL